MTAVSHSQQVWAASTFKAKYEQIQCFKLNDFSGAFMWPTPTGALLWLAANCAAKTKIWTIRRSDGCASGSSLRPEPVKGFKVQKPWRRFLRDQCFYSVLMKLCFSVWVTKTNKQTTTTLVTFPEFHYYKIWPISFNNLDLTFILENCSGLLYPLWLNIVHELYLSTNTEQGCKVVHSCFFNFTWFLQDHPWLHQSRFQLSERKKRRSSKIKDPESAGRRLLCFHWLMRLTDHHQHPDHRLEVMIKTL